MSGNRDFFGFCTTLEPLELKALGELSDIRHVGASEVIYSVGDEADALYIISRGRAEMTQENAEATTASTYLSRGDLFGVLELLTGATRRYRVRSCDGVSLRVFRRDSLDRLITEVPSFFRYLSEQLAQRLLQTREAAIVRSHCRELSGRLAQFDLVTIYQTITHSSQTGELSIRDAEGEVRAAFWFDNGQPRSGRFQHLTGEEAFLQLFLTHDSAGTFSFDSTATRPRFDEGHTPVVWRVHDLLIRAVQARDEFAELRGELGASAASLRHVAPALDRAALPEELRSTAQKLWELSLVRPMPLEAMWRHCEVNELTIYRAVRELLHTGHLEFTAAWDPFQKVA